MLAFPDFGSGESNIVGTIREVFTCTHHFSSLSAVAGFTKAMNCHLGMGMGTGNQIQKRLALRYYGRGSSQLQGLHH